MVFEFAPLSVNFWMEGRKKGMWRFFGGFFVVVFVREQMVF